MEWNYIDRSSLPEHDEEVLVKLNNGEVSRGAYLPSYFDYKMGATIMRPGWVRLVKKRYYASGYKGIYIVAWCPMPKEPVNA